MSEEIHKAKEKLDNILHSMDKDEKAPPKQGFGFFHKGAPLHEEPAHPQAAPPPGPGAPSKDEDRLLRDELLREKERAMRAEIPLRTGTGRATAGRDGHTWFIYDGGIETITLVQTRESKFSN